MCKLMLSAWSWHYLWVRATGLTSEARPQCMQFGQPSQYSAASFVKLTAVVLLQSPCIAGRCGLILAKSPKRNMHLLVDAQGSCMGHACHMIVSADVGETVGVTSSWRGLSASQQF